MKLYLIPFMFLGILNTTTSGTAAAGVAAEKAKPEADTTYADIKNTLGSIPTFLKQFPKEGITGAWMDMKGIQLGSSTQIPGKYKELIGVAVAAQIPCRFCSYFHTEAAKLNKATEHEISEAIAMAATTRKWSTFLTGIQMNEQVFKKDVDKMLKFVHRPNNIQAMEERVVTESPLNTAEDAYKEIQLSFGFVPDFFREYPQAGIVGLWKEMKGVEMNINTEIPGKYKDLIGLAVAAQTPCSYCAYYHTQSAIKQGATDAEINEAIALAGITREWSTVLNGHYTDEKKFMAETDQIMKFLKSKMNQSVGLRYQ